MNQSVIFIHCNSGRKLINQINKIETMLETKDILLKGQDFDNDGMIM